MTNTARQWLDVGRDHIVTYKGKRVKSVKHAFKNTALQADLPIWSSPYSLRHGMGRALRGLVAAPPEQISGMLGHTYGGMSRTSNTYASYAPGYMSAVREGIDTIIATLQERSACELLVSEPVSGKLAHELQLVETL